MHARYVRSQQYTKSLKRNTLYISEFGTLVKGLINTFRNTLHTSEYDNTNVSVVSMEGGEVFAMTETPNHILIDKQTLETKGKKQYNDKIQSQTCAPHPIMDYDKNILVNVFVKFGRLTNYQVVEQNMQIGERKVTAVFKSKAPFYLHSFRIT